LELLVPLLEVLVKVLIVLELAPLSEGLESLAPRVTLEVLFEALLSVELIGLNLLEGEFGCTHDRVESLGIVNP